MPTRPPHNCQPGCPALVPAGTPRCPAHTRARQQMSDATRGSRHQRGYGTAWDATRAAWFATSWPGLGRVPVLCGDRITGPCGEHSRCVREGRTVTGRVLDHITRKELGGPDEPANFQTLCDTCHNVKRQAEGTRGAR